MTVRTYYMPNPQWHEICARGRVLREVVGTLAGHAAGDHQRHAIDPASVVQALGAAAAMETDESARLPELPEPLASVATVVNRLMSGLSFERSHAALPSFALALLENPSEDEQRELAADVKALVDDANLNEQVKILLPGAAVVRVTGPELLTRAVEGLGDIIKADQRPPF